MNEIIVSVSFQDTVGSSSVEMTALTNSIEDKKVEKNEKREKMLKSNSKLNTRVNSKSEKECSKCEERDNLKTEKVVKKQEELSIYNYNTLLVVKYKMDELKKLCTKYKISKGGNKDDLTKRIYEYCKNSVGPLRIQKVFRGFLCRKLHRLQGPALGDRKICTNDTDFFTMDDMSEIPTTQFYSYRDEDDFVYGFNIVSLYNLIQKEGMRAKNPYNRSEFGNKLKDNVWSMIRI